MWYLDIAHNGFAGTLPVDWVDDLTRIRHLYMEYNQFTGPVPTGFIAIGNGRVEQIAVNNNQLTGEIPGDYGLVLFMARLNFENNQFTSMNQNVCDLIVYNQGNLIDLSSDCDICNCRLFCDPPFCS
jgi:hypothetical protein